jgi:hypothetical protein
MRILYPLFEFKEKAIALVGTAVIMVILLGANVTIANAQQQQQQQELQQLSTSQPITTTTSSETQNATIATTTLFESAKDSFRVQVPEGWRIQDVNNTGFTLAAEVLQGYGILAQLCPEGQEGQQQQQQGAPTNVNSSCQQQAQEEIIHIIRYPNLDNRLGIAVNDINDMISDSILEYQIQKLQEVGYRDINIVNTTDTIININYTTTGNLTLPEATIPARLVEMTYSTDSAPGETQRGYFIITATNATPPHTQTITGYSIFYEGATAAEQTTTPSGSLLLPATLRQVTDSFELIASEQAVQILLGVIAQQAMGNQPNDQVEENGEGEEDEDEDEDEG